MSAIVRVTQHWSYAPKQILSGELASSRHLGTVTAIVQICNDAFVLPTGTGMVCGLMHLCLLDLFCGTTEVNHATKKVGMRDLPANVAEYNRVLFCWCIVQDKKQPTSGTVPLQFLWLPSSLVTSIAARGQYYFSLSTGRLRQLQPTHGWRIQTKESSMHL